jgi:RNA polymerase sigma factor (sigma-70 family)
MSGSSGHSLGMGQMSQELTGNAQARLFLPPTDFELVKQARAGSAPAFDVLYRRHLDPVYSCAARILHNDEEAEEMVQDTFLTAWEKLSSFHFVDQSALPWLLVTCRYKSLNQRRKIERRDRHQSSTPLSENTPGLQTNDADGLELADLVASIDNALSQLSALDRRVFELCFVEGMTYRDAATSMGATNGSVRNRLSRLRDRMRGELQILKGSS